MEGTLPPTSAPTTTTTRLATPLKKNKPVAVQGTNDSSVVSKLSAVTQGYSDDHFLNYAVDKPSRRSPLINRGYYIRYKALDTFIRHFYEETGAASDGGQPIQVISLGAGFDMTYFRLKSQGLLANATFFEIDFPDLMRRKLAFIDDREACAFAFPPSSRSDATAHPTSKDGVPAGYDPSNTRFEPDAALLETLIRHQHPPSKASKGPENPLSSAPKESVQTNTEANTADVFGNGRLLRDVRFLGCDLSDTETLGLMLKAAGLQKECPTLLISECVLTYVKPAQANKSLSWLTAYLDNCTLANYEQIIPDDGFGTFMRKHFDSIGSSLQCISKYPTCHDQEMRVQHEMGFDASVAVPMSAFYNNMLDQQEKERIAALELFDEFEEWAEKTHHYMICIGGKGSLASIPTTFVDTCLATAGKEKEVFHHVSACRLRLTVHSGHSCVRALRPALLPSAPYEPSDVYRRFGHCSAILNGSMVVFGGFGGEKTHRRRSDLLRLCGHSFEGVHTMPAGLRLSAASVCTPHAGQAHDTDMTKHTGKPQIFHTASPQPSVHSQLVSLTSNVLLLIGGRQSPARPLSNVHACIATAPLLQLASSRASPRQLAPYWVKVQFSADDEGSKDTCLLHQPARDADAVDALPGLYRHTCDVLDGDIVVVVGGCSTAPSSEGGDVTRTVVNGDVFTLHIAAELKQVQLAADADGEEPSDGMKPGTCTHELSLAPSSSSGVPHSTIQPPAQDDNTALACQGLSKNQLKKLKKQQLLREKKANAKAHKKTKGANAVDPTRDEPVLVPVITSGRAYRHPYISIQRHSHASCTDKSSVFIYGGIDRNGTVLSDVVEISSSNKDAASSESASSSPFSLVATGVSFEPPLPPRFGHKMEVNGENGAVVVCGGCSTRALSPIERFMVLYRSARTWQYVSIQATPGSERWFSQSLMFNHAMVADAATGAMTIAFGGGNCFSFGTKFDPEAVRVCFPRHEHTHLTAAALSRDFNKCDVLPAALSPIRYFVKEYNPSTTSAEMFESAVENARLPALFRGCNLGHASQWTFERLAVLGEGIEVSAHVSETSNLDFLTRNFKFEVMTLPELLERASSASLPQSKNRGLIYLRSMGKNFRKDVSDIEATMPRIYRDFQLPQCFPKKILGENKFSTAFRVTSAGVQLWTHYDIMDNVLFNVIGRKRVILFPPSQVHNLYVDGSTSAVVDVDLENAAATFAQYPRFRIAMEHAITLTLEPGDALYMPAKWFHNVRALTPCVSINCFYYHLPQNRYQKKDLYGNKDLPEADQALKQIEKAARSLLSGVAEDEYRQFYIGKALAALHRHASHDNSTLK